MKRTALWSPCQLKGSGFVYWASSHSIPSKEGCVCLYSHVHVFTCLCDQTWKERKRRNRLDRARGKVVRDSRRERNQGMEQKRIEDRKWIQKRGYDFDPLIHDRAKNQIHLKLFFPNGCLILEATLQNWNVWIATSEGWHVSLTVVWFGLVPRMAKKGEVFCLIYYF